MANIISIAIFLVILLFSSDLSANTEKGTYKFGGSCSSQGSWTAAALSQTRIIKDAIMQLKDDPSCKGIESIMSSVEAAEGAYSPSGNNDVVKTERIQSISKEIGSTASSVKGGASGKQESFEFMMSLLLEDTNYAGAYVQIAKGAHRTAKTGLDMLNKAINILPQYDECLFGNPSQAAALFGATLKLTSSFISSGETLLGQMSDSIASFVTFMRNKKFSTISK